MLTGVLNNWRLILTLVTPVILSVIPILWKGDTGKEPYGAFVILMMAIYWMAECLPLAVTSFLPVLLFPLFGILSTDKITTAYLQDSIFFLYGGCIIALSFEYSNLHTRIALKVVMWVGPRVSQLLGGMMFTTMFLSMWMNNTSTTAMMVPIVNAIMGELHKKMLENVEAEGGSEDGRELEPLRPNQSSAALKEYEDGVITSQRERTRQVDDKIRNLRIMFLLGTAYASNIGGTGVITGSSTNVIALDLIRKDAEEPYTPEGCRRFLEISFLDWMVFNVPPMVINTVLCWLYLQLHFQGIPEHWKFWKKQKAIGTGAAERKKAMEKGIARAIADEYRALGKLTFQEAAIIILFLILVILWVFKNPQVFPGWDYFFAPTTRGKAFIKEVTPTLLIAIIMLVLPSKIEYYMTPFEGGLAKGLKDPLLKWSYVKANFPWGIFLLLGGGSAMARGVKASGLNKWVGHMLEDNENLTACPDAVLLLILLFIIAVLTTIASNTACAAILTPVLLDMSYVKDIHPLYLVLAATTACSYAFVLPVSTPPNAIVYTSCPQLRIQDMIIPGLVVNIFSLLVIFATTNTTSSWFLGFGEYGHQCENMTVLALLSHA